ncbi:MAG: M23 family metallopeptidase [Gammaproteobacteria bacterium]|nr:M23 family metallopeptidase [Gammaproteobacteria bacterium]
MNMNIILLPEGLQRGHKISISHRQAIALFFVGIIYLPLFFGLIGTKIHALYQAKSATDSEVLQTHHDEVARLRAELRSTRVHAESHLNALAQRMGTMQARLLRLDALGSRLTEMAKIDSKEFDFSGTPAIGGPANPESSAARIDIIRSLDQLKAALDDKSEYLAALESVLSDQNLSAAVTPAGWPTQGGWISSHFGLRADPFTGKRSFHEGIDIAARMDSPILALADGVVTWSGERSGYGVMVEITHGQGYTTRYAHAGSTLVSLGDRIARGQPVAKVGTSGRSTGPHLHIEIRRLGKVVDPVAYLTSRR